MKCIKLLYSPFVKRKKEKSSTSQVVYKYTASYIIFITKKPNQSMQAADSEVSPQHETNVGLSTLRCCTVYQRAWWVLS